jgi:flagellar export protein FliJ
VADYRLQTVLDLRDRAEQAAKEELAGALHAMAACQAQLKRLEEDLARRKADRAQKVAQHLQQCLRRGSGAAAMQTMSRYEKRLRDEEAEVAEAIVVQRARVDEAEEEVEARRAELALATREKKAVEKHKEGWARQVRTDRDRKEEQAGEEVGNALFQARRKGQARH